MSKHFHDLKVGDELEIKGPIPKLQWEENKFNNVGLIAGKSKRQTLVHTMMVVANEVENDYTRRNWYHSHASNYSQGP
jgi:cytochrome-b5 reductase